MSDGNTGSAKEAAAEHYVRERGQEHTKRQLLVGGLAAASLLALQPPKRYGGVVIDQEYNHGPEGHAHAVPMDFDYSRDANLPGTGWRKTRKLNKKGGRRQ